MTFKLAVVTIASAMLFGVAPVFASGSPAVIVGSCPASTPYGVGFFIMPSASTASSITTGLGMVSPGGTVYVCPGAYKEQVSIGSNVNLIGLYKSGVGPAIMAPAGGIIANTTDLYDGSPVAAQVLVKGGASVSINGFTVDGSNNLISTCPSTAPTNLVGVYYRNSSGTLSNLSVKNQALSPSLASCPSGLGVYVESGFTVAGTSVVQVQGVSVTNFQENGITAEGPGANVAISNNIVTGAGPTAAIAQNGIQVSDGAIGSVSNNRIQNLDYTVGEVQATGILVYASKGVSILGNIITGVQTAIVTLTDPTDPTSANPTGTADGAIIVGNTITGLLATTPKSFLADGIDACSSSNTISLNTITNTVSDGIDLDRTCGVGSSDQSGNYNLVTLNNIQNSCSAILLHTLTELQNLIFLNTAGGVKESIATNGTCPGASISNPLQVRVVPSLLGRHL